MPYSPKRWCVSGGQGSPLTLPSPYQVIDKLWVTMMLPSHWSQTYWDLQSSYYQLFGVTGFPKPMTNWTPWLYHTGIHKAPEVPVSLSERLRSGLGAAPWSHLFTLWPEMDVRLTGSVATASFCLLWSTVKTGLALTFVVFVKDSYSSLNS